MLSQPLGGILLFQAPDVEVMQTEGLDLDLVQQMRDLAVQEETGNEEEEEKEDPFDKSCPSSKVKTSPILSH